jgi:hypothetical protein
MPTISSRIPMPEPSAENIALARQQYGDGVPVAQIVADTGMSYGTLYYWVDGGPDDGAGTRLRPLPRRRVARGRPLAGSQRASLLARLWRTAERQVRDIEYRLGKKLQEPGERERDARVLAAMVKTLRDLSAFDRAHSEAAGTTDSASKHDEPVPRDVDELRRELARRVDILRQRRAAAGRPGDGEPELCP